MSQSEMPNFQMIHIASELVALAGLTFYFTSKHNAVNTEIKNIQNVINKQQSTISALEKQVKELMKNIGILERKIKMQEQPPEMFAMMGGPPFFPPPQNPEHNIEIINESPERKQPSKSPNDLETDSQLDDQLQEEFDEINKSREHKKQMAGKEQLSQHSSQQSEPKKQEQLNLRHAQDDETKLKPLGQSVLIDFGKNDLNDRPPSSNSQLSIQEKHDENEV